MIPRTINIITQQLLFRNCDEVGGLKMWHLQRKWKLALFKKDQENDRKR